MKDKNTKEELQELSSFLHQMKEADDSEKDKAIPANYFQNFEDRLMHRIKEEEALTASPSVKDRPTVLAAFWQWLQWRYVAFAGMTCVLLLVGVWVWNNNSTATNKAAPTLLADLSVEETHSFVINNIEEFETEEIVAMVDEEVLENMQTELAANLPAPSKEKGKEVSTAEDKDNALDKALEASDNKDLLDDLTEEDLEGGSYELF